MTYFKGKLGEGHVKRRDYSISTEDGKALVQSENWGSVVKKGNIYVMSMVVKKVALRNKYAQRQRNVCPRCYDTQIGVMPDEGWLQWYVRLLFYFPSFGIINSSRQCEKRFRCAERAFELDFPPWKEKIDAVALMDFRNIHVALVTVRKPHEWLQRRLGL
jgi:hypothetical protein